MVGAAVSLQSPGGGAMSVGVSTGCNSAGTTGTVSNVVILCGGSNVTLSESINGQSATITIIGGAGAGASFDGGVSSSGNTLGTTGTVSKEIVFVGGSNITLSQSSVAGGSATITIIGGAGAGASFDGGVSDLGNTLGTTGTVSNEIVFVGGSNITLSQSINANSATITVNALSQSQQTQNIIRDVIISGNTSGTTANITSGTLVLAGGAGLILFQNANTITLSVSSHYSAGVSNLGNTSGTTGTVGDLLVLAGGNNITLSQSVNLQSATVTISSPNMLSGGISNLGNTAGTSGAASELLILAGGSNITLSQSIDAASSVATVTIIGQSQSLQTQSIVRNVVISGNTSGTTANITSGTLTLAGGNSITLSQVGNAITISGASTSQSVQTQNLFDLTLSGNTSGTLALVSSGTLTLAGGNNITLSQVGNAITISGASQSIQTQSIIRDVLISGNTSGTTADITSGTLTLAGGQSITLSQVGNAITISGASTSQSIQTQSIIRDVVISGNTTGTTADITSGTLTLAGGNNITLSQVGNAITISGGTAAGATFSAGVSTLGNTAGTTGVVTDLLVFAGGSNITVSQSINAGSATITINAATVAGGSFSAGVSNIGNTSGSTGTVSQQLVLAGGNNITLSQSTNGNSATVTISAFNQTVQTQNVVDITLSGNTTGTLALISSGTLTLAGGNNITLSQAGGNAVTISAASQSIQTQSIIRDVLISGNTSGTTADITSGTLILAGGNSITLSQNGNSVTISGATTSQSVQTQSIVRGVVIGGNTSGTTASITSGTLTIAGGNNITVSQAGGNAITISAPEIPDFGVSNVGNTSGVTGTVNAQLILAGGNNITVSQSTNGQLATVTISAAQGIILVSNSLVTASAQVLSFTGANVTDHAYTFHMYISNPLNASPVYSVMYNGVSAGITRDYMVGRVGTVTANSDNNPIAFNLSASEEAHHIIHMMFHTTPVRMYGIGNEATLGINQGAIRQTGTGATNVTAIVISANAANAIGPNSRIIWYKHG